MDGIYKHALPVCEIWDTEIGVLIGELLRF